MVDFCDDDCFDYNFPFQMAVPGPEPKIQIATDTELGVHIAFEQCAVLGNIRQHKNTTLCNAKGEPSPTSLI